MEAPDPLTPMNLSRAILDPRHPGFKHPISYLKPPKLHRKIWNQSPLIDLQKRAARLLKGRSEAEIQDLVEANGRLLGDSLARFEDDCLADRQMVLTSPARHLLFALTNFNASRAKVQALQPRFAYFAALGAKLCSEVTIAWDLDRWPPARSHPAPTLPELLFDDRFQDAAEAILVAEALAEIGPATTADVPKAGLRLANRKAANQRHAPLRAIKERFASFAQGRKGPAADKARSFYRSLTPKEKAILSPTRDERNAVRTLTNFLRRRV